jgi:hypothetical protein
MFAHSTDPQVLQESTRALEKHAPIALSTVFHICGDLVTTLPPVLWRQDPLEFVGKSFFDHGGMKAQGGFDVDVINKFFREFSNTRPVGAGATDPDDPTAEVDSDSMQTAGDLDTIDGYRKNALRDELDSQAQLFALPGPFATVLRAREAGVEPADQLKADMERLEVKGCQVDHLLVPGPKDKQLELLVEGLQKAATKDSHWSAHDGELLVLLLGHYAWHSEKYARKLVASGAAKALVDWLKAPFLTELRDPAKQAHGFPLQRAVTGAIANLCKYGQEGVDALLDQEVAPLLLNYVAPGKEHPEMNVRRNTMRCIARMLPHSSKRKEAEHKFDVKLVWEVIIRDLGEKDDALRTAASAVALEAVFDGWCSEEAVVKAPLDKFAVALVKVLDNMTPAILDLHPTNVQSNGALPVLLTTAYLVKEELNAAKELHKHEKLLKLLMRWLPVGSPDNATSVDRAAAAGAASTLEALSNKGAKIGVEALEALLRHGSGDSATMGLRMACRGALEPAIQKEDNVEVLAQLFSLRIPRPGGSEKLAQVEILLFIIQRILALLKENSEKVSDRLAAELERSQGLLPKQGSEESNLLHNSFADVMAEIKKAEDKKEEHDKTHLPPIR